MSYLPYNKGRVKHAHNIISILREEAQLYRARVSFLARPDVEQYADARLYAKLATRAEKRADAIEALLQELSRRGSRHAQERARARKLEKLLRQALNVLARYMQTLAKYQRAVEVTRALMFPLKP